MNKTDVCTLHCQHNFEFNNASRRCRRRRSSSVASSKNQLYQFKWFGTAHSLLVYTRSPEHSQWTMSLLRLHITDFPQAILCESSCTREHRRKYHQSPVVIERRMDWGSGTNEVYAQIETHDCETMKENTTSNNNNQFFHCLLPIGCFTCWINAFENWQTFWREVINKMRFLPTFVWGGMLQIALTNKQAIAMRTERCMRNAGTHEVVKWLPALSQRYKNGWLVYLHFLKTPPHLIYIHLFWTTNKRMHKHIYIYRRRCSEVTLARHASSFLSPSPQNGCKCRGICDVLITNGRNKLHVRKSRIEYS